MVTKLLESWPLAVRVPLITAVLIFVVAVGTTQVATAWAFRQQVAALERLGAVYLDGISAAILPYAQIGDAERTAEALGRALSFYQGIRDRQIVVMLPGGTELAHVTLPGITPTPPIDTANGRFDARQIDVAEEYGIAWIHRPLLDDGRAIARIHAEIDISELLDERRDMRLFLLGFDLLLSAFGAFIGYLVIKRMVTPITTLTARFEQARLGNLSEIPYLPGTRSPELNQLVAGFNRLVQAVREREELTSRLAEQEKMTVLGRLAASLAHEVRNPLGGMLNAIDTIRKFGDDAAVRERSLNLLERGLVGIGDMVGAVLDTYRGPAGLRHLTRQDFDDLHLLVQPEAQRHRIHLDWDVDVPQMLLVNATEIRQIVLNLLLNACNAAPPGGHVGLTVRAEDDALRITIEDDGPGLPPPIAEALSDQGETLTRTGTGMGVSVVMRLVRDLKGRVSVLSESGAGTRIVLTLPLAKEEARHAQP